MQRWGVDYFETYAPVASINMIKMLSCEAFMKGMTIHQLDIKTAYLYGVLEEEVYMKQPKGYARPGEEDLVCKLNKAITG